jgi:hypothetical protein
MYINKDGNLNEKYKACRSKCKHTKQKSSNEVEDGVICHKSASDGGVLWKENHDNQNSCKEVEDMIECHKSASDGGEEVEDTIICDESASDGGALAGMS